MATEALRDWKQETITIWEADLLAHGCRLVDDRWKDRAFEMAWMLDQAGVRGPRR